MGTITSSELCTLQHEAELLLCTAQKMLTAINMAKSVESFVESGKAPTVCLTPLTSLPETLLTLSQDALENLHTITEISETYED